MMTADMEDLKRRFLTIEKQFAELKGQMMGDGKTNLTINATGGAGGSAEKTQIDNHGDVGKQNVASSIEETND